jgi:hemolysin activation/secretion protein
MINWIGITLLFVMTTHVMASDDYAENEVWVENVTFSGGTTFTDSQLQTITKEFTNRYLDSGDMEELRHRITRLYIEQGYVNSGASLDGYDANTKQLHISLNEGKLQEIRVKTTNRLNSDYVANRLALAKHIPFHLPTLQQKFTDLLEDPIMWSLHGSLLPGANPGEAILDVESSAKQPFEFRLTLDNHGPVSLGEKRGIFTTIARGLSGGGETIMLALGGSDGNKRGILSADIPVTVQDTRVKLHAEHSNTTITEEPIEVLDIKGDYSAYEISLVHPWIKTAQNQLNLGISLGRRHSKSTLLGIPFSFTQGSVRGRTTTIPLRFTQEWFMRRTNQIYSIRSAISFGLNVADATPTHGPIDARFVTWLLQQRYSRRLPNNRLQFSVRLDTQFADSALPTVEQVAIGGVNTVRGYRENYLVRDQFVLGSLELRYLLFNNMLQSDYGRLEGIVFTDMARSWNKTKPDNGETIHSAGLGLTWLWRDTLQTQIYWGHTIKEPAKYSNHSWQDDGFHVQFQAMY